MQLPPLQRGKSVWYGPAMNRRKKEWVMMLVPAEILELETAVESFKQSGKSIGEMNKSDFALPIFSKRLNQLKSDLIHGIGFSLIKGLPLEKYSAKEAATIFYGIGTHLGNARSQNAKGHVLGQVRNMGLDSTDPKVRLYQTNERQTFHTDSCDVVGLLCMQPAKKGGLSLLVSANTVFNEMHHRRPDLLQLLLQPIATDRRGEVPEGMLPYLLIPVFSYYKNKITPFYQRQYIESAQRFPDAPRLTPAHFEALDLFDELCNDSDLHLTMMLEKGDMQFVYNHAMLHDRTGFLDNEAVYQRRHLSRLWLSIEGDRQLPEVFATRYGSIEIGNRGGIMVEGTQLTIPWMADLLAGLKA
ncbi:MAG: TauD/TfdA family dioxygenase [Saprospiraceae bacterium]